MSPSALLYGLNFSEIMIHETTKLAHTHKWIPWVGFAINGILTTYMLVIAIIGNHYFLFNHIVITFNVGASIAPT
jgi:hypothetical protein